ncbi:MAG: FAD-dependent oxidoreductase [Devosia sp.]|nr:FAD-dependent oxidoreductase [Devosia sp.]
MKEPAFRLPADAPHGFSGREIDRSRPIRFRLNGRVIPAFAGDTVLSAVLAAGLQIAGRHGEVALALDEQFAPPVALARNAADPRGALPMDRTPAVDRIDLVTLGNRRDLIASHGMLGRARHLLLGPARTLNHRFGEHSPLLAPWRNLPADRDLAADVLVVGGGVAGLSAAVTALAAGRSVILVERSRSLGGALPFFGAVDNEASPEATITGLVAGLPGRGQLTTLLGAEAIRVLKGEVLVHHVELESDQPVGHIIAIRALQVVVATGAFERLPVFPGNRTPGVVGSLAAFQRARRFGVWPGRRVVVNTPHSFAYRLALHARDAGIEVQRLIDTRINPHSRFVDFCKAVGVTLASGLVASHAEPLARNRIGLRVGFAVAIDDIVQDATALETDQLIAAGGWQPELALWTSAGGEVAWDGATTRLLACGSVAGFVLVGAAAGYHSTAAAIASGRAAVLAGMGQPSEPIEDRTIDAAFETPDAETPVAPYRAAAQGAAYLDRGATLLTGRATAQDRSGRSELAAHPVAPDARRCRDRRRGRRTGAARCRQGGGRALHGQRGYRRGRLAGGGHAIRHAAGAALPARSLRPQTAGLRTLGTGWPAVRAGLPRVRAVRRH